MKIPINSSKILVLFDLDNTLVGDREYNQCKTLWDSIYNLKKIRIDPVILNFVRWSVLSERPKWNKFFIRLYLSGHGLYPEDIFLNNTNKSELEFKINLLNDIFSDKGIIHCKRMINKIFYVDNNAVVLQEINSKTKKNNSINFCAMNLFDFLSYDINYIVS